MGRIRTIKPEFHAHEELSSLPAETHLLAAALTNYADDEGYFNANPDLVRANTHPLRRDATPVEQRMLQLEKIGYIETRQCTDGKVIGKIVKFTDHQRVSHARSSLLAARFEEGVRKENARFEDGVCKENMESSRDKDAGSYAAGHEASREFPEASVKAPEGMERELNGFGNRAGNGVGNIAGKGTGEWEARTAAAVRAGSSGSPPVARPVARGKLLGTLPLYDRTEYEVREDDLARDAELYPGVDVPAAYRAMKAYLLANPRKLKTRSSIRKFMHNWLSREQDDVGNARRGAMSSAATLGMHAATSTSVAEFMEESEEAARFWRTVEMCNAPRFRAEAPEWAKRQ